MKKFIITTLILLPVLPAQSCLILVVADGERVLVGNHEDWYARDARLVLTPPTDTTYGMLTFDFASEGYAQGGMNSEGLFFDGAATPYAPVNFGDKPAFDRGYFWTHLLGTCATVEEAVDLIQKYRLPELQELHILLADRSGQSVVIGTYEGALTFHYRKGNHQLVTNFNLSDPSYGGEPTCSRHAAATRHLQADFTASVENVRAILAQTHQEELTVYSNIYDLTEGKVYVYSLRNFNQGAVVDLAESLEKDAWSVLVADLVSR